MSGFNKVVREGSLRRHWRKDLKKGRDHAMRAGGKEEQGTALQEGAGLAWPGDHKEHP